MIELRGRLVVLWRPVLPSVERDGDSPIIGSDHALRVRRINPQSVIVAMWNLNLVEEMPAIGGLVGVHIHDVEHVLVARIGDDMHVVPRPLPQAVAGVYQLPRLAAVVRPIQPAIWIVGLDQRVHAIRIRRHRHSDLAVRALSAARALPDASRSFRRRWTDRCRYPARHWPCSTKSVAPATTQQR